MAQLLELIFPKLEGKGPRPHKDQSSDPFTYLPAGGRMSDEDADSVLVDTIVNTCFWSPRRGTLNELAMVGAEPLTLLSF